MFWLKDAPIVILDEATAFTDPENEDKIQRSLMALSQGKTLLVIAHRLSTIQNADQIVVQMCIRDRHISLDQIGRSRPNGAERTAMYRYTQ